MAGVELNLPEMANPIAYIQKRMAQNSGVMEDLPFWTKMWPGAMVLAGLAAKLPPAPGPILELGAGLGLPGLMAAKAGHEVLLTDLEPDAMEFARAAAEANGLEHLVRVERLDWTAPPAGMPRFHTILGAEVLYQPKLYPVLVDLMADLAADDANIYLSHQERPFVPAFFDLARARFKIRNTKRTMLGEDGPVGVILYALKGKKP